MRNDFQCRFPLALILVGTLLSWTSSSLATSSYEPLRISELTAQADLAVRGTVQTITSSKEHQRIYTHVEVQVSETLKGRTASESVTLKLYGGAHGGLRIVVDGAPCFRAGEEVVLFLVANGSRTYDVVSLAEGKFEVDRTAPAVPRVARDLSGIHYLRVSDERFPESLDELQAAVRAAAGR